MSPNILLILTDQQRWDSLGCYNTPGVHTPNLDHLATEGIRLHTVLRQQPNMYSFSGQSLDG